MVFRIGVTLGYPLGFLESQARVKRVAAGGLPHHLNHFVAVMGDLVAKEDNVFFLFRAHTVLYHTSKTAQGKLFTFFVPKNCLFGVVLPWT